MKTKLKFEKLYESLFQDSTHGGDSIGSSLYGLYTDLAPDVKTKSGARVSDVLKDIIDELNDIVAEAESDRSSEALTKLVSKLKID
jgi:hypothetical protein